MYMNDKEFFQWYNGAATSDDLALMERVEEFGEYFEDMLFKPGSISYQLTKVEAVAVSHEIGDDLPDELAVFDYSWFRYKAAEQEDCDGSFYSEQGLLCVPAEAEDSTVLHEMIHLHESVINELPMYWHDMLLWALYQHLRKLIPALDEIITQHAHLITGSKLYKAGGLHDILFLLKSFDLDIRMGYPLGTVFGYGRMDDFKEYKYTK